MALPDIIVFGNAVRDAAAGTDKNGRRYVFVTVAQNRSRPLEDGSYEDTHSIFFDVAYWGVPEDIEIPKKGDRVKAAGQVYMEVDEYQGQEYHRVKVDAFGMKVFRKKSDQWPGQQGQAQGQQRSQATQPQGGFGQQPQQPNDPWNSAPAPTGAGNQEPPF